MALDPAGTSAANFSSPVTSRVITRSPTAIGNLIIIGFLVSNGAAAPTISDTGGHTWTAATTRVQDAGHGTTTLSWYTIATTISSITITVQSNVAGQYCSISCDEFSGNDPSPLDRHAEGATGQSGTPTSPSITPSVNGCLVWAYTADAITAVGNIDGSPATQGGFDGDGDGSEWRILMGRAGIAMTAAFAGSGNYNIQVATFKPLPLIRVENAVRMRAVRG